MKIFIALLLWFAAPGASADGVDVRIKDPWIRIAPPNVTVLAAYLEIKNSGRKPQIITNVSSTAFGQAGIHRSILHENMSRMEHLKELAIPPQTTVTLRPGGIHLMLVDAKKSLHIGDQIPITLTFSNGKKTEFMATVRSDQPDDGKDRQHPDHHSGHNSHAP